MSIASHLHQKDQMPAEVRFLYTVRQPEAGQDILFLSRLHSIAQSLPTKQFRLQLHLTGAPPSPMADVPIVPRATVHHRRVIHSDLLEALGKAEDRAGVVCYICGPPAITDDFVSVLRQAEGMEEERVLCEKWW
jgi:NAD(P)H-flavin reductase